MEYVAWDIEISEQVPENADWDTLDIHVSCGATYKVQRGPSGDTRFEVGMSWYTAQGERRSACVMAEADLIDMLQYLDLHQREGMGHRVTTWNGAAFDFKQLARLVPAELRPIVKDVAWGHIDPAFQMFCERGYMVGLSKAAAAFGSGKTEGMHGGLAPVLWGGIQAPLSADDQNALRMLGVIPGTVKAQALVRDYCIQDAKATWIVTDSLAQGQALEWVTDKGTVCRDPWKPDRLLTVRECMSIPLPDTSWMSNPRTREQTIGWLLSDG